MPAAPLQPPPRTCAIFSMSTSEASCHGRELSRAVTRRELTAEALHRPGKALRCFPSFFPGCRPVRARARSKLFCKKVSSKNFTLATARPPPRTCAILSMSTSGSELPLARFVPCGHAPRIENPGTGWASVLFLAVDDFRQLLHEAVDIFKLPVHRGEPHVGHLVYVLQFFHGIGANALGGYLPVQGVLQ